MMTPDGVIALEIARLEGIDYEAPELKTLRRVVALHMPEEAAR